MQQAESRKRSALARLAPLVPDLRDVLVLAGLALLVAGVGMIYEPAALIVAGVALLGAGVFGVPKWDS